MIALCILALFNNLEDKHRGETEFNVCDTNKRVGLCVQPRQRGGCSDSVSAVYLVETAVLDLEQDRQKVG